MGLKSEAQRFFLLFLSVSLFRCFIPKLFMCKTGDLRLTIFALKPLNHLPDYHF